MLIDFYNDNQIAKYVELAYGYRSALLRSRVEARWPEWVTICRTFKFKHTPEFIFAEVVWSVGFLRTNMSPKVSGVEFTVLNGWLNKIF